MSIENKLTYLDGTKNAIKQAIIDKGVSVSDSDTFRSYATKIGEIQGGSDCPNGVLYLTEGVPNSFRLINEFKDVILPSNMDNVTNMYVCFKGCSSLTSITLPELPNVTNMESCFSGCTSLTSITLPSSLPNVTNMESCFADCSSLTSITLPELPNVSRMDNCFVNCSSLTSITLPELPKVTEMYGFVRFCHSLTSITLPELPNVNGIQSFFGGCYSLTSIKFTDLQNLTITYYTFAKCSSLTSITLPDLPKITNMIGCFNECTSLQNLVIGNINPNISTLTNWNISTCNALTVESLVNIMNALPTISSTKTCTIGTTNVNKLSPEQLAIGTNKGWTIN